MLQSDENQKNLDALISEITSQRLNQLPTLMNHIDMIEDSLDWETDHKNILILTVKHALGEEWTEEDHSTLHDIAYDCREHRGNITGTARSILPASQRNLFAVCTEHESCSQHRQKETENSFENNTAKIYPNPSKDIAVVEFSMPFTGEIQLLNAAGVPLFAQTYTNKKR